MRPKIIAILMAMILLSVLVVGCSGSNPVVTLKIQDRGDIKIELYPKKAPNTVNNFIYLVEQGFYDGLTFHRIAPGVLIQGGDPKGDGTGDPGYKIKGEFASNGFEKNDISHTSGVVSMARATHPDSAGSQFFIMIDDATYLDGDFAAFGKVIEGMNVVEEIGSVETGAGDFPLEEQVIERATIELSGYTYRKPEKLE